MFAGAEVAKLEPNAPLMMVKREIVLGVKARSARERYHSAVAVSRVSARYKAEVTLARCQRPSLGTAARPSRSEWPGACRIQTPSTARALTGSDTRRLEDH